MELDRTYTLQTDRRYRRQLAQEDVWRLEDEVSASKARGREGAAVTETLTAQLTAAKSLLATLGAELRSGAEDERLLGVRRRGLLIRQFRERAVLARRLGHQMKGVGTGGAAAGTLEAGGGEDGDAATPGAAAAAAGGATSQEAAAAAGQAAEGGGGDEGGEEAAGGGPSVAGAPPPPSGLGSDNRTAALLLSTAYAPPQVLTGLQVRAGRTVRDAQRPPTPVPPFPAALPPLRHPLPARHRHELL